MREPTKLLRQPNSGKRQSPGKLKASEADEALYEAMQDVSVSESQSMQLLRYANRVPLQFKMGDCAITKTIMSTNWRSYGLTQSRGSLPNGPLTVMVHMASVWVPFTSESKEAIASYPEIEKEIRLGVQAVGRKLGMFMRRRKSIRQEGERRSVFLRYLGEVATAVNEINGASRDRVYADLLRVAERKTKEADTKLDKHGKKIDESNQLYGDNVLIVDPESPVNGIGKKNANGEVQGKLFDQSKKKAAKKKTTKTKPVRSKKK